MSSWWEERGPWERRGWYLLVASGVSTMVSFLLMFVAGGNSQACGRFTNRPCQSGFFLPTALSWAGSLLLLASLAGWALAIAMVLRRFPRAEPPT